jgi:hypothetical protein
VRATICLRAIARKREIRRSPVNQRDNEDGLPRTTIEGGAARPDALNPAPQ